MFKRKSPEAQVAQDRVFKYPEGFTALEVPSKEDFISRAVPLVFIAISLAITSTIMQSISRSDSVQIPVLGSILSSAATGLQLTAMVLVVIALVRIFMGNGKTTSAEAKYKKNYGSWIQSDFKAWVKEETGYVLDEYEALKLAANRSYAVESRINPSGFFDLSYIIRSTYFSLEEDPTTKQLSVTATQNDFHYRGRG